MTEPPEKVITFKDKQGREHSHWSTEMYHALITVVENEKPSKESDLPELARKIAMAFTEMPRKRRNKIELQGIKDKIRRIPLVTRWGWTTFLRRGCKVVDFGRLPMGILSPAAYSQWEKQRKEEGVEERGRRRDARQAAKGKGNGNRATRGLQAKYEDYKITLAHSSGPATRRLTLMLNDLQGNIARAVEHRLLGAGRRAEDIVGDLQLPSTDAWNEVWELLTGCSMPTFEPGISRLQEMRQTVPLTLEVLGRAVVGVAVARWALMRSPVPELDEVTTCELRALRRLNLRVDRTGGAYVNNEARRRALEECVVPKIKDKALMLAREVDALLLPFMMPRLQATGTHGRVQTMFPSAAAPNTGVAEAVNNPEWVQTWHSELANIFETALTLRVQIEQDQGECTVDFAKPGEIVVPVAGAHLGHEDVVLISMFPHVWVEFPNRPGGDLLPAKLISEPDVYIFARTEVLPHIAESPSLP